MNLLSGKSGDSEFVAVPGGSFRPELRPHLSGRLLGIVWSTLLLVALPSLVISAMGLALDYRLFRTVCRPETCLSGQLDPANTLLLQQAGISLEVFAAGTTGIEAIQILIYFVVSALILRHKPVAVIALFAAFSFLGAATNSITTPAEQFPPWLVIPAHILNAAGLIGFFIGAYTFPDGRFVPGWLTPFALGQIAVAVLDQYCLNPLVTGNGSQSAPVWLSVFEGCMLLLNLSSMIASQVYRYRKVSDRAARQQTKWFLFGLALTVAINILIRELLLLSPDLARPGSLYAPLESVLVGSSFLPIPVTLAIAIIRYQLWNIDIIINRSLVYSMLTAGVVAFYTLVVSLLGFFLQDRQNLLLSLLTTGLVAVLFQPFRLRVQRWVNILMYGERDDPFGVISRLGQRLDETSGPEDALETLVYTLAQSLKLPFVSIELRNEREADNELFQVAAQAELAEKPGETSKVRSEAVRYGTARGKLFQIPLSYHGCLLGSLNIAPRQPGVDFSRNEQALLENLARHTGVTIYALQLNTYLQRLREQLVTVREEERRRIRRDLHDGLGPQLAGQALSLSVVRKLVREDPQQAEELLAELERQIQSAVADIRQLVYNLRPPALDDLGLIAALSEQAAQYHQYGLEIEIEAQGDFRSLTAAVEVAAYRIVQEALTNVLKHSGARKCRVLLQIHANRQLDLFIEDDGVGLPSGLKSGVGFNSMRERAAELGGTLSIHTGSGDSGARVEARLPLRIHQTEGQGRSEPERKSNAPWRTGECEEEASTL